MFTKAEGTVKKYLDISLKLADTAKVDPYLSQSLEIVKRRIEGVFGKDKTKQIELEGFFG